MITRGHFSRRPHHTVSDRVFISLPSCLHQVERIIRFFWVHHGVCWRFDASIRRGQTTRKCKYVKVYWFDMVGGDFQLSCISYRFKDVEISWYVCESWRFILRFRSVHRQIKVLKNQISELSKANYELEREARMFDQRIGLLINYKKATEVG